MTRATYDDLTALYVNGTLTRSPEVSDSNQRPAWDEGSRFGSSNPEDR